MSYLYVLSDLAGTSRSELPGASGKSVAVAVGSMATAGYTVRQDHPEADFLLGCDSLLRVYDVNDDFLVDDDRVLLFHGRQVTAEESVGDEKASVATTYADPYWTLLRRLAGKSKTGYTRGAANLQVDLGLTIISELVNATNGESPSGVRMGNVAPSSSAYVNGWFYKRIGEAIAELCATLDGPDWRVRPIEYATAGGGLGYYGELDIAPVIGRVNRDVAFEHGDGLLNVRGYKRAVTLEGSLNRAHHLPPGFPDNATQEPMMFEDAGAQAARGLLEDVVTADLAVNELREKLLRHHIAVRKGPRQTITLDPVRDLSGRVPRLGRGINVGDIVPFRSTIWRDDEPVPRLDILVRLYQWSATVDDHGAPTPTLTVTPN